MTGPQNGIIDFICYCVQHNDVVGSVFVYSVTLYGIRTAFLCIVYFVQEIFLYDIVGIHQ